MYSEYVFVYLYTYIHIYIYIHTYVCVQIHIYIYIYIYIWVIKQEYRIVQSELCNSGCAKEVPPAPDKLALGACLAPQGLPRHSHMLNVRRRVC